MKEKRTTKIFIRFMFWLFLIIAILLGFFVAHQLITTFVGDIDYIIDNVFGNNDTLKYEDTEYDVNYKEYIKENGYNKNEIYTGFNYKYITSPFNENLKNVSYERYVYKDNNWVIAENKSPLFCASGEAILLPSDAYYIPIYELEYGKNKVVITEIYLDDSTVEKEYIINRIESEFDDIYTLKDVKEIEENILNPFQKELIIEDTNNVLLTGCINLNTEIKDIQWKRYEKSKTNNAEWESVPKSQTNRVFYSDEGNAKLFGNYWTIDIMGLALGETKIEVIATDVLGNKITENILIKNSSGYIGRRKIYKKEDYTTDGNTKFINNEILISFEQNVEASRCREIIKEFGGEIISVGITNLYQVQLKSRFNTIKELREYGDTLEERYDEIYYTFDNSIISNQGR